MRINNDLFVSFLDLINRATIGRYRWIETDLKDTAG